jgi:glycosyltransferase involved in cell wall biosynthesis
MDAQPKKVVIVHDWLVGGGAERVVLELHRMYPDAPVYTSYCTDEWRAKFDGKVITGYLQHWPFSKLRKFLPVLRIRWFEHLDLSEYDLVISSSGNGEAKGVKAGSQFKPGTTHVCYCHSPTHFYWRHYDQYLARPGFGAFDPLARFGLKLLIGPLRKWDLKASKRPDHYIANSEHIKADIKRYYDRDATVIHPPIDVERFETSGNAPTDKRHGFITVGRQTSYKKTDIIVEACTRLNLPLTVIGRGPENQRLRKLAGPSVTFVTTADDQQVVEAMQSAEAFIFAGFEDFGITPVEAMAAGTPVIAYKAGGALDYVEPGETGEFFEEQTIESLVEALEVFKPHDYDHAAVSRAAEQFSAEQFKVKLTGFLTQSGI